MSLDKNRLDELDQFKSTRDLYRLNGQLQRFAVKTFFGLMLGFWITDNLAPDLIPEKLEIFKIQILVCSMIGIAIIGIVPWLRDPSGTWKRATSEPGDYQGICNRCAAFMPLVALGVVVISILLWLMMMYGGLI
ncbi:MAG TPA: hypothetical protein VGH19_19420 [Verrucomicrobiae bacterium]